MKVVKDKHFENRGNLYTIYDNKDFQIDFVQDKISKSYQGVIRGFPVTIQPECILSLHLYLHHMLQV